LKRTNKKRNFMILLKERVIDGIIMREQPNTEELLKLGIPTVIASYREENISEVPCVDVDCAKIGKMAAEHFLNKGFRKFAYCGFDFMYWSRRRAKGFADKLAKAGFDVIFYTPPKKGSIISWDDEQPYVRKWLESLPKPVGLFTCNDDRGEQVIEACRLAGIRLPDEVAVLGVDNDEFICNLSAPPLSSVRLSTEKAGFEAAETLGRLMAGELSAAHKTIMVSPIDIVTRQSTDMLAIEDPEVAKAVHFIRHNSNGPLQVMDVVNVANLSRCGLYLRFHKALGYSVYDEIKRSRAERIAKLLLNSDLSISQIALQLGFTDANHIARYFKKVKGMTPLVYRKERQ
jgi:LacI family transcriptional regulator